MSGLSSHPWTPPNLRTIDDALVVFSPRAATYCRTALPTSANESTQQRWCLSEPLQVRTPAGEALTQVSPAGDVQVAAEPASTPFVELREARAPIEQLPQRELRGAWYLWESYQYAKNYQHFFVQHAPKIADYLQLCAKLCTAREEVPRLLLTKQRNTLLAQDIMSSLGVTNVTVLHEWKARYRIERLYVSSYYRLDSTAPAAVWLWKQLRWASTPRVPLVSPNLPAPHAVTPAGLLYLQRNSEPSREHNDNAQGAARAVANEEELAAVLRVRGFTIIRSGRASLREKAAALAGALLVLTPVGANALNLLLQPNPPAAWLFIDPADLGAFSACWTCCMARQLWRERPLAHVLGAQAGVSLARIEPSIVTWAATVALDAALTPPSPPLSPRRPRRGAPIEQDISGLVRRDEPCVCSVDRHVVDLRWINIAPRTST